MCVGVGCECGAWLWGACGAWVKGVSVGMGVGHECGARWSVSVGTGVGHECGVRSWQLVLIRQL